MGHKGVGRLLQARPDPIGNPWHSLRRRSTGSRSGVWKGGQRAISPAAEKARRDLKKTQELLEETTDAVNELQRLYEQRKKD
jgi:hypothetical protein